MLESINNKQISKKEDSIYIVIPAYNEADNIEKVVAAWYPILFDLGG